eukprot:scaffold162_cov176-Amphora_coffeaeformis.AAC.49
MSVFACSALLESSNGMSLGDCFTSRVGFLSLPLSLPDVGSKVEACLPKLVNACVLIVRQRQNKAIVDMKPVLFTMVVSQHVKTTPARLAGYVDRAI